MIFNDLKKSLRVRLILGVSLIHLILMIIFVFDSAQRQSAFMKKESRRFGIELGMSLATNSESWILMHDYSGLQEIVESQKKHSNLKLAMVFSLDGKVLAHSDVNQIGKFIEPIKEIPDLITDTADILTIESDDNTLLNIYPITSRGKVVGKVLVQIDESDINQIIHQIYRDGLIYSLFAIFIGGLIAGLMINRFTYGLKHLMGVVNLVQKGERNQRTRVQSADEIGALGQAFDLMLDTLEEKERSLEQATIKVTLANVAKGEFLANMSHEIRTPMNGIIGLTDLALNEPNSPEVREFLTKISTSSKGLLGILNDILDFSKLEAGRLNINDATFDLSQMIENISHLFEDRAEAKKIKFSTEIQEGTPNYLIGDALRIQQVLSNLIGNAIKFTEKGYIKIKINSKYLSEQKIHIIFAVEDTGIGITQEGLDKLFQPFSQVDGTISKRFGGTGLGLVISRNLIQLMKGELNVKSQFEKGSIFSFELDLNIDLNAKPALQIIKKNVEAGDLTKYLIEKCLPLRDKKILVAEDDLVNQLLISKIFKLAGLSSILVSNGKEALNYLTNESVDIIFMDVHMPIMDGIEAVQALRAQPQWINVPIIALTAGVTPEEKKRCLSVGMNDFVAKPYKFETIVETLRKWT